MKHVRSRTYHVGHIEPRDDAGNQPNEVWVIGAGRIARTKAHFKSKPENGNENDRLHRKPGPTQRSTASLLHKLEYSQVADLLSPRPMVFQYRREGSQEKLLAVQKASNLTNCNGNQIKPPKRERIYLNCGEASTVDGSSPASTAAIISIQVSGSS